MIAHKAWRPALTLLLVCAIAASALLGLRAYMTSPTRGLPDKDPFAQGNADHWETFGGTWEVIHGMVRNDSDERGAKLLTGSKYWRNYSVDADVMLLGPGGDAGLIVRSSNEEQGVDAYTGYYAGLRNGDNSLILGRADYGWTEAVTPLNPAEGRVTKLKWYHLKVVVYGCQIAAVATATATTASTASFVTDKDCIHSGRVGLRSYESGGIWRNVVIRPAMEKDIAAIIGQAKASVPTAGSPSGTERNQDLQFSTYTLRNDLLVSPSSPNTQPISNLRLANFAKPVKETVRGSVILTSPILVVEDSTGGVSVPHPDVAPPLKVGDQVEVTGLVHPSYFSSTLQSASVRVLWEGTPIPAMTVSASQAATGAFDATFIEVEGRLRSKSYGPDNTLLFRFDEGPQSFSAIMNRGRGDYLFGKLKPNSLLRMRGIATADPVYTKNLTPFVLLLRSADDIDVLAGPPWWSTGHLISVAIALLGLALAANFFYSRAERWRLRAVLDERERLAHEMHDTLAQSFAGIGFQLEAIRSGVPGDMGTTHQQLNLASDLVRHSHEEARRSIATLRPESLEGGDVLTSLGSCAHRMVEGGSVEIHTASSGDARSIPVRISDTLYRIGQEAIANAVRHAHPSVITISVEHEKDRVSLLIADDGTGFTPGGELHGFGVSGMRKRAASISSRLDIDSVPGRGTRIKVIAPLPPPITLLSWPVVLKKYVREDRSNAKSPKLPH